MSFNLAAEEGKVPDVVPVHADTAVDEPQAVASENNGKAEEKPIDASSFSLNTEGDTTDEGKEVAASAEEPGHLEPAMSFNLAAEEGKVTDVVPVHADTAVDEPQAVASENNGKAEEKPIDASSFSLNTEGDTTDEGKEAVASAEEPAHLEPAMSFNLAAEEGKVTDV